jgi:hypothetical protein
MPLRARAKVGLEHIRNATSAVSIPKTCTKSLKVLEYSYSHSYYASGIIYKEALALFTMKGCRIYVAVCSV